MQAQHTAEEVEKSLTSGAGNTQPVAAPEHRAPLVVPVLPEARSVVEWTSVTLRTEIS